MPKIREERMKALDGLLIRLAQEGTTGRPDFAQARRITGFGDDFVRKRWRLLQAQARSDSIAESTTTRNAESLPTTAVADQAAVRLRADTEVEDSARRDIQEASRERASNTGVAADVGNLRTETEAPRKEAAAVKAKLAGLEGSTSDSSHELDHRIDKVETEASKAVIALQSQQVTARAVQEQGWINAVGEKLRRSWDDEYRNEFGNPEEFIDVLLGFFRAQRPRVWQFDRWEQEMEAENASLRQRLHRVARWQEARDKVWTFVLLQQLNGAPLSIRQVWQMLEVERAACSSEGPVLPEPSPVLTGSEAVQE